MTDFSKRFFNTNHELIRSRFEQVRTLESLEAIKDLDLTNVHKSEWNPMKVIYSAQIRSIGEYKSLGTILNQLGLNNTHKGYRNLGKRNEYRVYQGTFDQDDGLDKLEVTLRAYKPDF